MTRRGPARPARAVRLACSPPASRSWSSGAARASSFVLIALYLQQALVLEPEHAGAAMVPDVGHRLRRLAQRAAPGAPRPRPRRSLVIGLLVRVGLAAVVGVRASRWVRWSGSSRTVPGSHRRRAELHADDDGRRVSRPGDAHGTRLGMASSATQVGAALQHRHLHRDRAHRRRRRLRFPAAFVATAVVAVATTLHQGAPSRSR